MKIPPAFALLFLCLPARADPASTPPPVSVSASASPTEAPPARSGTPDRTAWLGVVSELLPPAVAAQLPPENGGGLLITHVVPGSPAAAAGLETNDVLVKFGPRAVGDPVQFAALVGSHAVGDAVALEYFRRGALRTATATLAESRQTPRADGEKEERSPSPIMAALHELLADFQKERGDRSGLGQAILRFQEKFRRALGNDPAQTGENSFLVMDADASFAACTPHGLYIATRDTGRLSLTALDPAGGKTFDGPFETPEEQAKAPENVRRRVLECIAAVKECLSSVAPPVLPPAPTPTPSPSPSPTPSPTPQ